MEVLRILGYGLLFYSYFVVVGIGLTYVLIKEKIEEKRNT